MKLRALTKPWLGPILALNLLVIGGTIGYRLTEGWDLGDCLWMVLITITTIGFGEVEPLSAAGRVVTVLIITGGLIVVQLTIQRILRLADSGYFRQLKELRFRRVIRRMRDHVIVCGYGRIGQEIAEQLLLEGVPILVVEIDPSRKLAAEECGLNVLQADATLDETLLMAGLEKCKSLVATLPNNAANLYVILSAKGLRPECRLIARAESQEAAVKLKLAGASVVVSPYVAAGRTMAATALRPLAVDFMDLLAGSNCEIEEFRLSSNPELFKNLAHRSLSKLQLGRDSGAMVLAIRDGSNLITNPGSNVEISPGQLLVVLGSKSQLTRLRDLLGQTLETVEQMSS
ncbi:potassium channel family protein [Prochlorococcus sp. MIT 1300]|uniref:potassium channel family protein n=1 Tax=Prochlorococcus sp. MIT 1300 TaxID=3096218 RepID=UPI002A7566EA|nr:NAD-binding protein [Prochlorococcus sp. MIT 1300]